MKLDRYGLGLAKGMTVTIKHLLRHPVTTQYPEQREVISRRSRGNELIWDKSRCTGCASCARTCPQGAIKIITALNSDKNRYDVSKFEIDTGYCIQCGLCVEVCPYAALFLGYSFERAKYRRGELVQANDALLASPERPVSGYMYPDIAAKLPAQTLMIDRDRR